MIQGKNILCISSIDWDFIWQGHQQIMSTLAAQGNRVLFVENTGVRRPVLRDASRIIKRLRNWWRGTKGFRQERENLFVYSPLVLPFPYSRVARWINRSIIVRAVRRWMDATGIQHPIVWTFLPTSLALDLIKAVDPEIVIYYCIDDFQASSSGARSIRRSEDRLCRDADLVFVTSERLRERVMTLRPQADLFPFGVDFSRFEAVRHASDGIPDDLDAIRRPIVGYVGGLHRVVDQQLVAEAARRLPDVSFVFIGPEQCDVSTLSSESTVTLLGARPHGQLPGYIKGFDVGIVPYTFNEYSANVYPTKLNEYLAMGIPVVATGLPEIRRFNQDHGDIVTIADGPEMFASALRGAIDAHGGGDVERRIAVAKENSWDSRLERMSVIIAGALAARRSRQTGWEDRLRRLYRTGRQRAARTATIGVALYVILFHTAFVWSMAEPLQMVQTPRPADAIVVFAGGVGESGTAGGGYQERVRHAVGLYRAGLAPRLIFSSGFVFAFREAEVMRDLAVNLGVPRSAITLEQRASSTMENVVNVRDILSKDGASRILLVSSPYHMRRAVLTWQRQAPKIEVVATPVPSTQYYAHDTGASIEQIRGILWEYAALAAYRSRGWL